MIILPTIHRLLPSSLVHVLPPYSVHVSSCLLTVRCSIGCTAGATAPGQWRNVGVGSVRCIPWGEGFNVVLNQRFSQCVRHGETVFESTFVARCTLSGRACALGIFIHRSSNVLRHTDLQDVRNRRHITMVWLNGVDKREANAGSQPTSHHPNLCAVYIKP